MSDAFASLIQPLCPPHYQPYISLQYKYLQLQHRSTRFASPPTSPEAAPALLLADGCKKNIKLASSFLTDGQLPMSERHLFLRHR